MKNIRDLLGSGKNKECEEEIAFETSKVSNLLIIWQCMKITEFFMKEIFFFFSADKFG